MANHCWNYIEITGNKEALDKIEQKFKEYDNFNYFTQFAQNFFGDIEQPPSGNELLHKWAYKYGTKWMDLKCGEMLREDDEYLVIKADTAWSPPTELSRNIAKHYDVLVEHGFSESGIGFAGEYEYDGEEIIRELNMDYDQYEYLQWGVEYLYRQADYAEGECETFEDFLNEFLSIECRESITQEDYKELEEYYNDLDN